MVKIIYEKDKCIGCGMCASVCPDHWAMGDDGHAQLKAGSEAEDNKFVKEVETAGCNQQAADSCPVQCIHVEAVNEQE